MSNNIERISLRFNVDCKIEKEVLDILKSQPNMKQYIIDTVRLMESKFFLKKEEEDKIDKETKENEEYNILKNIVL